MNRVQIEAVGDSGWPLFEPKPGTKSFLYNYKLENKCKNRNLVDRKSVTDVRLITLNGKISNNVNVFNIQAGLSTRRPRTFRRLQ